MSYRYGYARRATRARIKREYYRGVVEEHRLKRLREKHPPLEDDRCPKCGEGRFDGGCVYCGYECD